jgi:hypothetical protein
MRWQPPLIPSGADVADVSLTRMLKFGWPIRAGRESLRLEPLSNWQTGQSNVGMRVDIVLASTRRVKTRCQFDHGRCEVNAKNIGPSRSGCRCEVAGARSDVEEADALADSKCGTQCIVRLLGGRPCRDASRLRTTARWNEGSSTGNNCRSPAHMRSNACQAVAPVRPTVDGPLLDVKARLTHY